MTSRDRIFIESWKEQREGPKWKYYLQYTIAWGIVIFLCLFFLLLLLGGRGTGGKGSFLLLAGLSILFAWFTTNYIYTSNERRMKRIADTEQHH